MLATLRWRERHIVNQALVARDPTQMRGVIMQVALNTCVVLADCGLSADINIQLSPNSHTKLCAVPVCDYLYSCC